MAEPCKRPTLDFAPVGLEQIPGHRQSARPRPPCSAPGMAPASAMQTLCSPTAETIAAPRCGPVLCRRLGLFTILNLKTRHGGAYHLYAALGHLRPNLRIFIGQLTRFSRGRREPARQWRGQERDSRLRRYPTGAIFLGF